ncbi:MAG: acetate kinase [Thermoguttaceae bacterium]|jgi:acetate kinase|nr:acetate kinase [Thermoguttaceae bacterium]
MSILVVNAGSSSVKFALFQFDTLEPEARGLLDLAAGQGRAALTLSPAEGDDVRRELDVPNYHAAVVAALRVLDEVGLTSGERPVRVVGHRLIHGGETIRRPVRIDSEVKRLIRQYTHLAPLHIPAGLEAIAATEEAFPDTPQVGLFDTAFFARIPPAAYLYPVPYEWYEQWGIRRYGFHGTSHAYCTERSAEMLGRPAEELRLIICHLGQGSSAAAVDRGVAVTNTMGFTPLEGFMMGTRSGTVDPGILLYVMREKGVSVGQLDEALHKRSGLLGISGLSADFREVETAAAAGHPRARLALDMYAYRVKTMIGALAAVLGGLDALVFTGGIGENSHWLRGEVCTGLGCLGVMLAPSRNTQCRPDADLATPDSPARVLAIHTREDYIIAREAKRLATGAHE